MINNIHLESEKTKITITISMKHKHQRKLTPTQQSKNASIVNNAKFGKNRNNNKINNNKCECAK